MRVVLFVSLGLLTAASSVSAKDYTYTPPASAAVTEALQTPSQPQPPAQLALNDDADATAIDTTPGQIRLATRIANTQDRDDQHRGFACGDSKCSTQTPVYNTRTTIQQEQGRIQP